MNSQKIKQCPLCHRIWHSDSGSWILPRDYVRMHLNRHLEWVDRSEQCSQCEQWEKTYAAQ